MSERNDTSVRSFFDKYAKTFERISWSVVDDSDTSILVQVVNRIVRRSMRTRFRRVLEECSIEEYTSILDVGTGPGHYAIALKKQGVPRVVGLDFSEQMILSANDTAIMNGINDIEWLVGDFQKMQFTERFDCVVVVGVMDYIRNPLKLVEKIISITDCKAMFSFPKKGGFMAWQRALRYKNRCYLRLYSKYDIENVFSELRSVELVIEDLGRDYFVTAHILR